MGKDEESITPNKSTPSHDVDYAIIAVRLAVALAVLCLLTILWQPLTLLKRLGMGLIASAVLMVLKRPVTRLMNLFKQSP